MPRHINHTITFPLIYPTLSVTPQNVLLLQNVYVLRNHIYYAICTSDDLEVHCNTMRVLTKDVPKLYNENQQVPLV